MDKKKLLISFSGGETSGFMLWWILHNKSDEYEFIIVFANTGRETNETLLFVKLVAEHFGVEIIWVEALVYGNVRNGSNHKIVTFETATRFQDWKTRSDTPFELLIKKFGIPNIENRSSTRELKDRAITSYMRSIGWKNKMYKTAIGIRIDEFDRMSNVAKKRGFIYPLITWKKMTKKHVNFWWSQQVFRLPIKGYQGNCVVCYKKSDNKLYQLAKESPEKFEFEAEMERKYENYIPEGRRKSLEEKGKPIPSPPYRFFRGNKSVSDIFEAAKSLTKQIKDDSRDNSFQQDLLEETEACEVFTDCGQ